MADESKKVYPSIPANNWWALRKKFRSTIPKEVTSTYIASALGMNAESAKNILPGLRLVGLLDKENKPTDLAVRWRDDSQYPIVCQTIFENIYPQELKDLAPDITIDRMTVQKWFANHLKVGEVAARKLTSFYFLLLEANPVKENETSSTAAKTKPRMPRSQRNETNDRDPEPKVEIAPATRLIPDRLIENIDRITPQIHFNIQVVLPENALSETYDAIFRSIATHLLGRTGE